MADVFWQYNGDSLYLGAFLCGLAILYFGNQKRAGAAVVKKAALAVILAVVFVFNEIAYRLVGRLTDSKTYYRFFWMLPVLFVIAYLLTQAFFSKKKRYILTGIAAFVICLAFGANLYFLNRDNISRPKNIYGLAPDTITISDEIMADWNSGGAKKSLPKAAFDMYLQYQVRTYEPRITWSISRKAYLYQAEHGYDYKKYVRQQHLIAAVNEGIQEDGRTLRRCLEKDGVNYLVIRTAFAMDRYLAEISVLPVADSENYTIYKVM